MATGAPSSSLIRFGVFQVNLRSGESLKHGARLRLQGQPLEILRMLLERPGEVVTREELRQRLWSVDTFVDFDHSLNTAVKKLRQTLGDSADHPLYIETLSRAGYRFIAPIEKVSVAAEQAAEALHGGVEAGAKPRARNRFRVASVFGLAVVCVGIGMYALVPPASSPKLVRFQQITASGLADGVTDLVSDGARVYFLERKKDGWDTVQTSTAGGETQDVRVPFRNTLIFDISRDRSEFLIGQFDSPGSEAPLWTWPVQGGSPVRVGDVRAVSATWRPDGNAIYYSHPGEIRAVNRDGSGDRVLIRVLGNPGTIHWSPDGSRISYAVGDPETGHMSLWEAAGDGSNPHARLPIPQDHSSTCCGTWTPDGRYFLFGSLRDGVWALWAQREGGWAPWSHSNTVQLTSAPSSIWGALPVRDGSRLLAYGNEGEVEHQRYDANSHQYLPFPAEAIARGLRFSPDGQWVAYQRVTDLTLWRSKFDGEDRVQLVGAPLKAGQAQWSPDGLKIAFEGRLPDEDQRVYVVNAEGGPAEPIVRQPGIQGVPAWSPDGKSIAFSASGHDANANGDGSGIFVMDWATRNVVKLAGSEKLTSPMWSPDGKYLCAKTYQQDKISIFDPALKKWNEIQAGQDISGVSWSRDSKYLYFQDMLEAGQPIYRLHASDWKREKFLSFETYLNGSLDRCVLETLAPDGSPIIGFERGLQIYALDVDLP
jgi:Tol biopolymer transport system component/DNA-binding winged helix-turn-helix (wHTH) protein